MAIRKSTVTHSRQSEPVDVTSDMVQPRQMVVTPNYTTTPNNPLNVFLVALLVGAAFIIGTLYSKVKTMETQGGTGTNIAANNVGTGTNTGTTGGTVGQPVNNPGAAGNNQLPAVTVDLVTDEDHIRGSKDAPIVLIEYSDIECPFCQRFHPTMKQVRDTYGDKVAWVYRHFPLSSIHPRAQKAAEATECVAELGGQEKFWTYLDSLVTTGSDLSDTGLAAAAQKVGVNQGAFTTCLTSGKYAQKVSQHMASGERAGVTGTPGTVLVAGGKTQLIPGAYPFEQLKQIIDSNM